MSKITIIQRNLSDYPFPHIFQHSYYFHQQTNGNENRGNAFFPPPHAIFAIPFCVLFLPFSSILDKRRIACSFRIAQGVLFFRARNPNLGRKFSHSPFGTMKSRVSLSSAASTTEIPVYIVILCVSKVAIPDKSRMHRSNVSGVRRGK